MKQRIKRNNLLKKSTKLIGSGLLIVWLLVAIRSYVNERRLLKYHKIAIATVISNTSAYRGGLVLYYKFHLGEKEFVCNSRFFDIYTSGGVQFLQKTFPVVYDETNPENNRLLVTKKKFEKYGVPFPDSLNWVRAYEK